MGTKPAVQLSIDYRVEKGHKREHSIHGSRPRIRNGIPLSIFIRWPYTLYVRMVVIPAMSEHVFVVFEVMSAL